jgi:GH35 family endo-1,4-beta-xylanase
MKNQVPTNNTPQGKKRALSRKDFLKCSAIALAATMQEPKFMIFPPSELGVSGPTLRSLANRILGPSKRRFRIGAYLEPGELWDPTGFHEDFARQQFNSRVISNVGLSNHIGPNQWDFWWPDEVMLKAQAANQSMFGMHLLWHLDIPDWIRNGGYSRAELITIIENHIEKAMTRYRGAILAYTVVNEHFLDGYDWFHANIGPDYVDIAFKKARQVDPEAILIYNHYNNHVTYHPEYTITLNDINRLKSKGLVEGVGVQFHHWSPERPRPTKQEVIPALQSYGLPVWVTEFDVAQILTEPDPEEEQGLQTKAMLEAVFESGVCDYFNIWGLNDQYAFDPKQKTGILDENNNAKPNYYAIQQVLADHVNIKVLKLTAQGAQDGWVLETSENSNQGGITNPTATALNLGDNTHKQQYRSILHFNTSSLPDNAMITRATLKIKKQSLTGTDPFTTHLKIAIDIRKAAFSNNAALQPTDFQAAASKAGVGLFANNPQAGGWYLSNLKAIAYPYINRTGITQFRLRFQKDDDNDAVADFIRFFSGNATAANRPILVIEYYIP